MIYHIYYKRKIKKDSLGIDIVVMMSILDLASRNFNESEVSMEQNFYDMSDHELLQAKMSLKREIDQYKKKMEELNGYLTDR